MKPKDPNCLHRFNDNGYCAKCSAPKIGTIPTKVIHAGEVIKNAAKYESPNVLYLGMSLHFNSRFGERNAYCQAILN